jgi:hypothetical protein
LAHEKHKVTQLERQLQFVKDNQAIFEKLREAYISMKYNEASGRKLVEIRDKSVQTWDGVLCRACLDTERLRSELERAKAKYNDCVVIKRDEMDKINTTVQALKSYISDQESQTVDEIIGEELEVQFITNECKSNSNVDTKKTQTENEKPRSHELNSNRSRSQSVDRGTKKINLTRSRKYKCKISKSSVDVGEPNNIKKRMH